MAYELEEVRISQEIFYYLLEHHELREEEEIQLYKAYTEQEEVQNLVKSQGEIAQSRIERYGNVIYLIPREENHFLYLCAAQGGRSEYGRGGRRAGGNRILRYVGGV